MSTNDVKRCLQFALGGKEMKPTEKIISLSKKIVYKSLFASITSNEREKYVNLPPASTASGS